MKHLDLTVTNLTAVRRQRPVTDGVPIAPSAAPRGSRFHLTDGRGHEVPVQTSVLGRWPDGSARWVILDFQASPTPGGRDRFRLGWTRQSTTPAEQTPPRLTQRQGQPALRTSSGLLSAASTDALLDLAGRLRVTWTLVQSGGQRCEAQVESVRVQERGPLRAASMLVGSFRRRGGERVMGFQVRLTAYADLPPVRIEPMLLLDCDRGVLHRIRELSLQLLLVEPAWQARIGAADEPVSGEPGRRLVQVDDRQYRAAEEPRQGQAPGWAELIDSQGPVSLTVRDFCQRWPKSLSAEREGFKIGLFPRFSPGQFDHMQPWYKYGYLTAAIGLAA